MKPSPDRVSVFIDGQPMVQFTLDREAIAPYMRRIHENWYILKLNASPMVAGMYHWHLPEEKHSFLQSCFKGSSTCMECGEEWPKDLTPIVELQLKMGGLRK